MSGIQYEINRINNNIRATYSLLEELGATTPEEANSNNLADTVKTVSAVLHKEQALTEEQKKQARSNIGAFDAETAKKLNNYVTPEMFGAVGDGETDDTEALIRCLTSDVNIIKFASSTYKISGTLMIKSNTSVDFNGATVKADFIGEAVTIEENAKDTKLLNGIIDANNKSYIGIALKPCDNVLLENMTVMNVKGSTFAYGIAVPCFGCSNVLINKCVVDTVEGVDDGEVGDANGWAKGIIVGFNHWVNEIVPGVIDGSTYSRNVKIINSIIRNIKTAEDGDGIYVEGLNNIERNPMLYDLAVIIDGNYFENCGKRFVKVIPAGGVIIRNNYGVYTADSWQTTRMHSFISVYAPNAIIENNKFRCEKSHVLYCIDIGVQSKYGEYTPGDIIIRNNEITNSSDREGDTTACVYYSDYSGYFKTVVVDKNCLNANYNGIALSNASGAETIFRVIDNVFGGYETAQNAIRVDSSVETLEIANNYIGPNYALPLAMVAGENVLILNNMIYANAASIVKGLRCVIKNNFLINKSSSHRFTVTTTGWTVSSGNTDNSGAETLW